MPQRKSIAPRRWLLAAVLSFCLMLLSLPALAGKVQLRDPGGLFSPADTSALRGEGSEYPFDVRIVASSDYDQKVDFDRYVRTQVNEPNVIVVGVDRAHRFTSVHFGNGLGVSPSQFKTIEQAGNPHFRGGNWRAGVEAILTEAKQAAHAGTATAQTGATSATDAPRSTAGSTVFGVLIVVLVVGGLIAFVGSILSRRARAAQLGAPGYPPGGPYPPGYGPGPGYGGGSGIGGNIAAAGLGGLVGYELGKMAGERHVGPDRDQSSAGVLGGDDRGNDDAGGATGGWDDGGGGGGDWGGGGDSGGGGGSDW